MLWWWKVLQCFLYKTKVPSFSEVQEKYSIVVCVTVWLPVATSKGGRTDLDMLNHDFSLVLTKKLNRTYNNNESFENLESSISAWFWSSLGNGVSETSHRLSIQSRGKGKLQYEGRWKFGKFRKFVPCVSGGMTLS